ncbi:MAG: threonine synthase [Deltaproteobacteria bacterium]|nr:threonine synthase [Deltaproteobacteria bacterium]MBW2305599.1 threonine synthase [Deltaproteobacteria bacterium]
MMWPGVIRHYRAHLPIRDERCITTLLEGNTPLLPARRITAELSVELELYFKCEGFNPTGSFKDRGMTVAVSRALEEGSRAVICASTGNTSASAAAYAARAGIKAYVLIPEGKIALGKLSQAMMHEAEIIQLPGNFDQALSLVLGIAHQYPVTLVNSLNPYRIEGQKTAAFEICDALGGKAPDYHILPVGNAGNITAYWKGYREYYDKGLVPALPRMMGFQAEGAAPIVLDRVVEKPETVATAIRIGNPASWKQAVEVRDTSGGVIQSISDEEILDAYQLVAGMEGVFCEPASAASIAGLIRLCRQGIFKGGERVVCTLTGHGLKDPDNAIRISRPPATLKADIETIAAHMGLE